MIALLNLDCSICYLNFDSVGHSCFISSYNFSFISCFWFGLVLFFFLVISTRIDSNKGNVTIVPWSDLQPIRCIWTDSRTKVHFPRPFDSGFRPEKSLFTCKCSTGGNKHRPNPFPVSLPIDTSHWNDHCIVSNMTNVPTFIAIRWLHDLLST